MVQVSLAWTVGCAATGPDSALLSASLGNYREVNCQLPLNQQINTNNNNKNNNCLTNAQFYVIPNRGPVPVYTCGAFSHY